MPDDAGQPWLKYQQSVGPWDKFKSEAAPGKPADQPSPISAIWQGLVRGFTATVQGAEQLQTRIPAIPFPNINFAREQDAPHYLGRPYQSASPSSIPIHQGPWPAAFTMLGEAGQKRMQADIDQRIQAGEKAYGEDPAVKAHPWAALGGRIGGETIATAPLLAGGGGAGVGARVGTGVVRGVIGGAMQPAAAPDYWTEKAKQAGAGGVAGGATAGVGRAIGPPLGQAAQDAIAKFPHIARLVRGDITAIRSPDNWMRAAVNQALDPIKKMVGSGVSSGHELINTMVDHLTDAYNKVLPQLTLKGTAALHNAITAAKAYTGETSVDAHTELVRYIESHLEERLQAAGGILDGQMIKDIQSEFGKKATQNLRSNPQLADAVFNVREAFMDEVANQNPLAAAELKNVNSAYAMAKRIEAAATRDVDAKGKFTPHDLLMAARNADQSPGKGSFAKGDGAMQAVAEAVLGPMSALKVNRILSSIVGGAIVGGVHGDLAGASMGTTIGAVAGPEILKNLQRATQTPAARGLGRTFEGAAPAVGAEVGRQPRVSGVGP